MALFLLVQVAAAAAKALQRSRGQRAAKQQKTAATVEAYLGQRWAFRDVPRHGSEEALKAAAVPSWATNYRPEVELGAVVVPLHATLAAVTEGELSLVQTLAELAPVDGSVARMLAARQESVHVARGRGCCAIFSSC